MILDGTNDTPFERPNEIAEIVVDESDGFLLFVRLSKIIELNYRDGLQTNQMASIVMLIIGIITSDSGHMYKQKNGGVPGLR